jgi:hypothetical protein
VFVTDRYQPIEDYGIIGDLHTVALVGRNGSIDFLSFPHFDSPTLLGFEFRLTAESRSELRLVRDLLRRAGFRPARPFVKGRQFRQPVYGRAELQRFLVLIDEQDA